MKILTNHELLHAPPTQIQCSQVVLLKIDIKIENKVAINNFVEI